METFSAAGELAPGSPNIHHAPPVRWQSPEQRQRTNQSKCHSGIFPHNLLRIFVLRSTGLSGSNPILPFTKKDTDPARGGNRLEGTAWRTEALLSALVAAAALPSLSEATAGRDAGFQEAQAASQKSQASPSPRHPVSRRQRHWSDSSPRPGRPRAPVGVGGGERAFVGPPAGHGPQLCLCLSVTQKRTAMGRGQAGWWQGRKACP